MHPFGHIFLQTRHSGFHLANHVACVAAVGLFQRHSSRRSTVETGIDVIHLIAQMHIGNVFQAHGVAAFCAFDDDVLIFIFCGVSTWIFQHIFLHLWAQSATFSQLTRRHFHILVFQGIAHIVGGESIAHHLVGMQPHAHSIVARAQDVEVAHTVHAEEFGGDVDVEIVVEKTLIGSGVVAVEVDIHQDVGFFARDFYPFSDHLWRQLVGGRRHAVLHIHGVHIGVCAQLKHHVERGFTVITGIALYVFHPWHAIEGLFQGDNHGFHQQFVVRSGIVGHHIHLWGRNGGKLRHRQIEQGQHANEGDDQRHHNRQHWSANKDLKHILDVRD